TTKGSKKRSLLGECRERFGGFDVLLVALLIALELLLLDGRKARAEQRRRERRAVAGAIDLALHFGGFQGELGVMRAFPCQPFRRAPGVRATQLLFRKGKCSTGRAVELHKGVGEQ